MQQVINSIQHIALVGFGNIGRRHLANCLSLFPSAIVNVVSSSGRELRFNEQRVCQRAFSDLTSLNLDFAIIASPASLHHEHSAPFLRAGVPILVEKPVSATLLGAQSLLQEAGDVPVSVGYCLRYLPAFSMVQQALTEGVLGRIIHVNVNVGQYLPYWRKHTRFQDSVTVSATLGGGVLLELSHELDYLQALFGSLTARYCYTARDVELAPEVELQADMLLMTESGTPCFVHMDALQKNDQRFCQIVGTETSLRWDLKNNTVTVLDAGTERILYSDPTYDRNSMYLDMVRDFVIRVKTGEPAAVSLQSAVAILELIENLKILSLKKG